MTIDHVPAMRSIGGYSGQYNIEVVIEQLHYYGVNTNNHLELVAAWIIEELTGREHPAWPYPETAGVKK